MSRLKRNFKALKLLRNYSDKNKRKYLVTCFQKLEPIPKNQRNNKFPKTKELSNNNQHHRLSQLNKRLKQRKKNNDFDLY